jgi:hypothetical protein
MQHTLNIANHMGTEINPGILDSNIYISPNEKFHIKKMVVKTDEKLTKDLTLKGWQKLSGQDKNSQLWVPGKGGQKYPFSDILINETDQDKTCQLDSKRQYISLNGNIIKDDIKLEAREAKVVFYRYK